ncbi:MAG: hypothetical protein OIN85_09845 [Candidatus Methanoperedens sp.]|nr:hypothetical protein [Candidatus Methanoperedens sp.]
MVSEDNEREPWLFFRDTNKNEGQEYQIFIREFWRTIGVCVKKENDGKPNSKYLLKLLNFLLLAISSTMIATKINRLTMMIALIALTMAMIA